MKDKNFSVHLARGDLGQLEFGDCFRCRTTVIRSSVKRTTAAVVLDPRPVGGSEINPIYSRHTCPTAANDET